MKKKSAALTAVWLCVITPIETQMTKKQKRSLKKRKKLTKCYRMRKNVRLTISLAMPVWVAAKVVLVARVLAALALAISLAICLAIFLVGPVVVGHRAVLICVTRWKSALSKQCVAPLKPFAYQVGMIATHAKAQAQRMAPSL